MNPELHACGIAHYAMPARNNELYRSFFCNNVCDANVDRDDNTYLKALLPLAVHVEYRDSVGLMSLMIFKIDDVTHN